MFIWEYVTGPSIEITGFSPTSRHSPMSICVVSLNDFPKPDKLPTVWMLGLRVEVCLRAYLNQTRSHEREKERKNKCGWVTPKYYKVFLSGTNIYKFVFWCKSTFCGVMECLETDSWGHIFIHTDHRVTWGGGTALPRVTNVEKASP